MCGGGSVGQNVKATGFGVEGGGRGQVARNGVGGLVKPQAAMRALHSSLPCDVGNYVEIPRQRRLNINAGKKTRTLIETQSASITQKESGNTEFIWKHRLAQEIREQSSPRS